MTPGRSRKYYAYPHDRKGGGLIVIILDFSRETLFACPFQIVFSRSLFMAKLSACRCSARGILMPLRTLLIRHAPPSHCTRDDYGDRKPIPSLFSSHLTCLAYIDTGLLGLDTRSELSTFVTKGRFPLLVVRYQASVPEKIYLFVKILPPEC